MAAKTYLTYADITHSGLKQFPEPQVQTYVDEANDHYEYISEKIGVAVVNIAFPIPLISKSFLKNYILMRFGEDNMGMTDPEVTDEDVYRNMYRRAEKMINEDLPNINCYVIMGTADNDPIKHSARTARRNRTS